MVWSALAGAATAGAFDIAGGLLGRPKHSQRDLMHMQHEFWERQMDQRYPLQVRSMRRAGLNPILAVSQSPPGASVPTPAQGQLDPLGEGISRAGNSARQAFLVNQQRRQLVADTKAKEADAVAKDAGAALLRKQAVSEAQRPGLLQQQTLQAGTASQLNRLKAEGQIFENKLKSMEIPIKEREVLIANIQAGLWRQADQVISTVVRGLGVPANKVTDLVREIKRFGKAVQSFDTPGAVNSAREGAAEWLMRPLLDSLFGKNE